MHAKTKSKRPRAAGRSKQSRVKPRRAWVLWTSVQLFPEVVKCQREMREAVNCLPFSFGEFFLSLKSAAFCKTFQFQRVRKVRITRAFLL